MSSELLSSLAGDPTGDQPQHPFYGVAPGIVTNNRDPEGLGRVKVFLPWFHESGDSSNWARVVQAMAGKGMGQWILPEIEDEVLVGFEHGDLRAPLVFGGLYNGVDRPPSCGYGGGHDFNENGRNDMRFFRSRSGHLMLFDDGDNPTGMLLRSNRGNRVELRTPEKTVLISSLGDVTLEAGRHVIFRAGDHVQMTARGRSIRVQARSGKLQAVAGRAMALRCRHLHLVGRGGSGLGVEAPTIQMAGTTRGSPGMHLRSHMQRTHIEGRQLLIQMQQGSLYFRRRLQLQGATTVVLSRGRLRLRARQRLEIKGTLGLRVDGGRGHAALAGRKVWLN